MCLIVFLIYFSSEDEEDKGTGSNNIIETLDSTLAKYGSYTYMNFFQQKI